MTMGYMAVKLVEGRQAAAVLSVPVSISPWLVRYMAKSTVVGKFLLVLSQQHPAYGAGI